MSCHHDITSHTAEPGAGEAAAVFGSTCDAADDHVQSIRFEVSKYSERLLWGSSDNRSLLILQSKWMYCSRTFQICVAMEAIFTCQRKQKTQSDHVVWEKPQRVVLASYRLVPVNQQIFAGSSSALIKNFVTDICFILNIPCVVVFSVSGNHLQWQTNTAAR